MKRRETDPASSQFPKLSPLSGTHRDSQSWIEKKGGGSRQGRSSGEKGQSKGEESCWASNLTLKYKWVLKIAFLKVQN